jgi:hypothetical protein
MESQSPRARRIVSSFMRLGQTLQRHQLPFVIIDHEFLAGAAVQPDGRLTIKGHSYKTLVLPEDVELPSAAATIVDQFRKAGGRVVSDQESARLTGPMLQDAVEPAHHFSPASDRITLGQFARDGHQILLVVNVAKEAYNGQLTADTAKPWLQMDPATGEVRPATIESGKIRLSLAPRQAVLLVNE